MSNNLDHILGIGGIGLQVLIAIFLCAFFFHKTKWSQLIFNQSGKFGLWAGLLIALFGTLMSLYYSEILKVLPCGLCWLQRVFLYPQVILFAIALWKEDRKVTDYAIGLSGAGALVALYQHYLQMGGNPLAPCISSLTTDCGTPTLLEFGYVTYPLLSLLSFALIILFMVSIKKTEFR